MNLPREIGPFEILESLGAGGMGEVFKARDTRLNRYVAIKFLPEHARALARERFQREALAIAALNHPHICTLYEVGDDNGRPYLVLELLEGETLRARLRRGALAPELLLDFGLQIADALQAAHAKGVLHRDLKPDNIWVGPGNHIKVLDFGLARLESPEEAAPDDVTLTSPGMTLGTIPYMSPEQARGEPLDARSDLFSFGSVFYEMATGRQPFLRANAAETTAAILKEQPQALAQDEIGRVIGRLLEKDPDLRYQSAADLRGELKRMKRGSSAVIAGSPAAPLRATQGASHWLWVVIACVIVAGAIGWWALRPKAAAPAAAPRLQFRQLTFTGRVLMAAISPDGKFLAHVDADPQGSSLHLLSIGSGSDVTIVPLAPFCCQSPSFSPDGNEVYFEHGRELQSVPVLGGAVRTIVALACSGAGFSPDGSRIAYVGARSGATELMLAHADGSHARVLRASPPGSGYTSACYGSPPGRASSHAPAWSPDGRWIALARNNTDNSGRMMLVNAETGQARPIGPNIGFGGSDVIWLPDGSGLVFTASIPASAPSQVWEIAYPGGKTTQLTSDLQGYANSSLARNGELVLIHSEPQYSIWVQSRADGAFQELPGGGATEDGASGLAWMPGDRVLSFRNLGGKQQLWTENSDGSDARPLPTGPLPAGLRTPLAAPNGQIVFAADGSHTIWRVNGDGTGLTALVPEPGNRLAMNPTLIRNGKEVAYRQVGAGGSALWAVPLDGGAPRRLWQGAVLSVGNPASPDGTRILAFGGRGVGPVVVRLDGAQPMVKPLKADLGRRRPPYGWTSDGRAITFIRKQGSTENIWAAPLNGGEPEVLTHFHDLYIAAYAFSKDGRLAVSRGTPNSDAVLATGLSKKP